MNWLQRKLVDVRTHRYARRRLRAFREHVSTLSAEEQKAVADGTHISFSHGNEAAAQPIAELLRTDLLRQGISADVKVGFYHMDRLVFFAVLDRSPSKRHRLPRFYRGFEVLYKSNSST